ncbi:MAG: PEGA domain-containing protein [Planctomycetota bacterium]
MIDRLRLALVVGVAAGALGGCVERTITITSEPAGALVHLNDEAIGRTPVTVPFTFYGEYDVRLDLAGYEPLWTSQRADAPWWEHPGPDLIGEMIPGNEVGLAWHFELAEQEPAEAVDPDALAARAHELADRLSDTPESGDDAKAADGAGDGP